MAPYRASIGGAFGGGAGPATAHPIDVGQILDSITNGASTLIQNAYARKRAQAEIDLNQQKADQEAQRYADQNRIAEQRYNEQNTRETDRYTAQQRLERQKLRIAAASSGVTLGPEFDEPGETQSAPQAPASIPAAVANAPTGNVDLSLPSPAVAPPQAQPPIAAAYQAGAPASVAPAPRPATGYHAENDPRIKRAVAQTEATERAKLNFAPLQATADSAKAAKLIPVHVAQAAAEKAATLPMDIAADSTKDAHKHLDADESTATAQLPDIAHGINILRTLPPQSARAALASRGGFWRNYLNSPEGQQFNQAAKQIALSGAIAKEGPRGGQPDRVKMFQDAFVPGAGDSDAVAEQKFAQLLNLTKEVKLKAGRGYERIDPATRAVIEGVIGEHAKPPGSVTLGGGSAAHPIAAKYGITPSTP